MKNLQPSLTRALLAAMLATATMAWGAQKRWSGGANDTLWSSAGNWAPPGMPTPGDTVIFTNDAVAVDSMTVNNLVDAAFTSESINALGYMNTNGFHVTQVNANLNVISASATDVAAVTDDGIPYVFFVGSNSWQDDKDAAVYTTINGNTVTVSNRNASLGVTQISAASGAHLATLDLRGLNSFTCVVSNVLVGYNFTQPDHAWRPSGELYLAKTNSITTELVVVADVYQNAGSGCSIHFGNANTVNADEIRIGMHKTVGTIDMAADLVNPSVTFRGASGTGRQAQWALGDEFDPNGTNYLFGFFTSNQARGTMDLTGAKVDALVDRIVLGRGQRQFDSTFRNGDGNGTLIFGGGTIDVNTIEMGVQVTGPFIGGSIGRGTLTVNNDAGVGPALLMVQSNIVMAVQQPGSSDTTDGFGVFGSQAAITVGDGSTVAVAGDIVNGGGTGTINLNTGGVLDMKPAGDAAPGNVSVTILNINDGVITNYATLSVSNINVLSAATLFTVYPGQAIAPAGIGTVGPLSVAGSLMLRGTTLIDIDKTGATTANDAITATGTVDLGGSLKVTFLGPPSNLSVGDKFTLFATPPVNSTPTVILPPAGSGLGWTNKIFMDGSIEVVACASCGDPTAPPTLNISRSPTSATVSWPVAYTKFVLQAKTNSLDASWAPVPAVLGNSVTIPFVPANQSMFFRLIQQ